ncbi:MAG TPA: trypsin-like peptidase domain-containing protein [Phycisphaerae bacterium]|nr:trypsin-like peptidase domain-containing protein [Phycisphaerae bacterium]
MSRICYAGLMGVLAVLAAACGSSDSPATAAASVPAGTASAPARVVAPVVAPAGENLRVTNDVRVYDAVKDAVVNITSSRIVTARVSSGNPMIDQQYPFLLPTQQVQASSLGSGFVIHPAGYIITNEHVIDQGMEVQCVFSNGDKLAAQVIATDNEHDLAVLKVTPPAGKQLTAIALGASDDLMIGEPVYAIGNPFGYAGTMTRGIVSAVNRQLDVSAQKSYKGLIQTDASINPGNSGGPLLNAYGQVIGVNTAIRADAQGIGFAISVSNMRDLLPAFLNPEVMNRAVVGFTLEEKREITPPSKVAARIVVKQVQAGSAAEKAGVKPGDEVRFVGGVRADNIVDALVALSSAKAGDTMALGLMRGAGPDAKNVNAIFSVAQAPPTEAETVLASALGIRGETVTAQLAARNHLSVTQGVLVSSVAPNSPAAISGIQPGDIVVQLDIFYIRSMDEIAAVVKMLPKPVNTVFAIIRGNAHGRGTISLK